MERVRYWQSKIKIAAHSLHAAMKSDLPVGCAVEYTHGKHTIHATVIGHTDSTYMTDPRIHLRGQSGKEYWLDLSRVERRAD